MPWQIRTSLSTRAATASSLVPVARIQPDMERKRCRARAVRFHCAKVGHASERTDMDYGTEKQFSSFGPHQLCRELAMRCAMTVRCSNQVCRKSHEIMGLLVYATRRKETAHVPSRPGSTPERASSSPLRAMDTGRTAPPGTNFRRPRQRLLAHVPCHGVRQRCRRQSDEGCGVVATHHSNSTGAPRCRAAAVA